MSHGGNPALELDGVCAAYGPYRALFGVSFSVQEGAALALLGPNGAGKSTVARVVSGLVPASSGRIRVGGSDVTGKPAWAIARAGLSHVPEGRGVFDSLSVEENLVLSLRRRAGRRNLAASLERA
ncbi:MAG: ATP-binding cassette domain-containing protein, partial [Acidimicrobiales bacterium]